MFKFRKKPRDQRRHIGVGLLENGVSMAVITRPDDETVRLEQVVYAESASIEATQAALHGWVKSYDLKGLSTNFVLAPHMFSLILTEAPEVKDDELAAALRFKVKEIVQYDLNDAVVEAFMIPGQKERGRTPMAYAVCAAQDVLRAYIGTLEQAQLNLQTIDIPQLGQRNLAHLLAEEKYGVAMVVLGQRSGMISICRDGVLYLSRDIEVGWDHFAKDDTNAAPGDTLQIDGMAPATQRALDSLVLEVQRSLDYYERQFGQAPIHSLVITPLPEVIDGLVNYVAGATGLQVRELDLAPMLNVESKLERRTQALCLSAIGAALRWPIAA